MCVGLSVGVLFFTFFLGYFAGGKGGTSMPAQWCVSPLCVSNDLADKSNTATAFARLAPPLCCAATKINPRDRIQTRRSSSKYAD